MEGRKCFLCDKKMFSTRINEKSVAQICWHCIKEKKMANEIFGNYFQFIIDRAKEENIDLQSNMNEKIKLLCLEHLIGKGFSFKLCSLVFNNKIENLIDSWMNFHKNYLPNLQFSTDGLKNYLTD